MNHQNMYSGGAGEKLDPKFHAVKQGMCVTFVKIALLSLLLSINPWGQGVSRATDSLEGRGAGETMEMSQMRTATAIRIPRIDAAAPKRFETATFAMG